MFLNLSEVARRLGIGRNSLYNLLATDESFPRPVQVTKSRQHWLSDDVDAWSLSRSAEVNNQPTAFVYVMTYGEKLVKIGISNDPAQRLQQLQRDTNEPLTLIAVYQYGDGSGSAAHELDQAARKRLAAFSEGMSGLFNIRPTAACNTLLKLGGRLA
ncbi:GIY-YIG nuclease family protein [Buttiauxella agrestis]|uniref:GIY-YIG nuclease family protein n=1 Tax=Buttiauxella agrestis TaxID=82977 RepID=UPI0015600793|nr:AlpA family phage regulatory protein [Buttiauxella agrestis]BCG08776.1 hypothetical protein BADSM9389_14350 [Buttiauxella agrestis]